VSKVFKILPILLLLFIAKGLSAQCSGTSGFTITASPFCVNQTITFTDTTSATTDSIIYRFSSDNSFVKGDTVTKTYTSGTTEGVWMYRFFSGPYCSDTVFQTFTVNQTTATVTPSAAQDICIGNSVDLFANTGTGRTYQWQRNGANIGGATDSVITVTTAGDYRVIATQNGCVDTSAAVTVTVYNYPNADFSFSLDSLCSGSTITYGNVSTGSSLSYQWDFGNGSTSNLQNPTNVFDTSGTPTFVSYQVTLIATTPGNCGDTITKTVYVRRKPDGQIDDFNNIPKFVQCNVSSSPFSLQIDNISSTDNTDSSYTIDWGDGSSQNFNSSFDTVTHVYNTTGAFTMTVTTTDSFGCVNTNTYSVFNGGNPAVSLGNSGSTSGCTPYDITFTIDTSVTGVGSNAAGTTYTLSFNDGSAPQTYSHLPPPSIVKTFTVPSCGINIPGFANAFEAELSVTNPCGTNSATIRPIYISTQPVAEIEIDPNDDDTVCLNQPFVIRDVSDTGSVSSNSGCNQTPRRLWDVLPGTGWTLNSGSFGNSSNWNNNPANWGSQELNMTFTDTGVYTVELIVGNIAQAGLSVCGDDTIRREIRVLNPPTSAFTFDGNGASGCLNHTVRFNNTSTGDDITYLWTVNPNSGFFLQSGTLTSDSPVFVFNTIGLYEIELFTENRCAIDSLTDTVIVKDVPIVTLPDTQTYCGPQTLFYDSAGTVPLHEPTYDRRFGDTLTYQWIINGANGIGYTYASADSATHSPTINFNTAGTYEVKVVYGNECGYDTATQVVVINPLPIAGYSVNDTDQCLQENTFVFTDTSTVSSGSVTTFAWDFGSGASDTSILQNPTKIYADTGTFTVRLIATTDSGCIDTFSRLVYVYPNPNTFFGVNDTSQCIDVNVFTFTNSTTIASGTFTNKWEFSTDPSDTSILANPVKTYGVVGTYRVKLESTSDKGCKDSSRGNVYVHPKPVAGFNINDTDQCLNGNSFVFTNTSTLSSGFLNYDWNFGGGVNDTSSQENPTKVYTTAGTFTVSLRSYSNEGCSDTATDTVYVRPKPDISFNVNDTDQCFDGHVFNFTNTSSIGSGTVTYLWQLSSSTTDTTSVNNPTKSYGTHGVYPIKLVGTSDFNCKDSALQNVTVYQEPVVDFTINDTAQCLNGNSFVFTDNSTTNGSFTSNWDFGDGTTSTQASPTKTYTTADTFTVRLIINVTGGGCGDTITKTVITYPKPNPAFNTNDTLQCFPGHLVSLTNNSTIGSGTQTYLWKFDAPSETDTSTQTSPTKVYGTDGTYAIRLIATSNLGCKDSAEQQVIIRPDIANNTIGVDQGICEGFAPDTIRQVGILAGGNSSFTYQWQESSDSTSWANIGGATSEFYAPPVLNDTAFYRRVVTSGPCSDTSNVIKITVTPVVNDNGISANQFICEGFTPAAFSGTTPTGGVGTFSFQWQQSSDSLNWINIGGATDTTYQSTALTQTVYFRRVVTSGVCDDNSLPVKVHVNPNAEVSFTTASVCFGLDANFNSTSTINAGTIGTYEWHFGDGDTTTSGSSVSHSYAAVGNYTIKLIVTSDSGCIDSTTRSIDVHPKPVAAFTVNDTCVNIGHSFNATTSTVSSGNITQYNWTFGDATTGLGSTINKTYTVDGNYNPELIIITDSGCRDTVTVPLIVHPKPSPSFTVNDSDQCVNGNSFVFTNTSTISSGSLTYAWDFGEGANDTSTQTSPTKTYAANGNYDVDLIATSNQGCIDSVDETMIVYAKPTPTFSVNDTDQCITGNSFVFTNSSTINPLVGLSYVWDFGNGDTTSTTSPTKTYTGAGTFPVKLVVTSINDCKDSVEQDIYVYPKPTPNFTINDSLQCFGVNSFLFTNTSTISSGSNNYFWRLDLLTANDTTSQTSPTKTYSGDGIFNIRLIVTSDQECKDSIQKAIEVKPDIVDNSISTDQFICEGETPDTLRQTATVSGGNTTFTYQWQQSTDSLNWSDIAGANDTMYIPPALSDSTWYRRIVGSGPCSDTSNVIRIAVTPAITNNTVTADQDICFQQAPNTLNGQLPGGGTGTFEYLWQESNNSSLWSSATGTNTTQNYSPGVQTDTIYYRRRVISAQCTTYSNEVKIAVKPLPVVDFAGTTQCFPEPTEFTDSSTAATGNTLTGWTWDFGDATSSTAQNPSKVYGTAGTFTVKLIAETNFGCRDSASKSITVHPKPTAAFTAPDSCFNFTTNFTNNSSIGTGSITDYLWTFGDGDSSIAQNPSHLYGAVGTYTATLILTSDNNCGDTLAQNIIIHPNPTANFSINDTDQCVNGNSFVFSNLSTIPSSFNTNLWNFGASSSDTSTQASPTKVYANNGNYNVELVTTTNFGCSDSITKSVLVYAKPDVTFAVNDTDQCIVGNNFIYTNNTTINPAVGLTYLWTLGQGITSTQRSPSRVYTTPGTYRVSVVVTSVNNCIDSANQDIYVYPNPVADYSINDTFQCFGGNQFNFTNNSTISSGTNTYFWRFDLFTANDTSTQISPTKTYTSDGTFQIRLTAISDKNCRDSLVKQVTVTPEIVNNTITASQTLCSGSVPTALRQTSGVVGGGNGTFTYQWQRSTDSATWVNISGATNVGYTPPAITDTTWFRRIVTSGSCDDTSAPIRIAIIPALVNNSITADQTICFAETPDILRGSTPTGGGGVFAYQWQQSNNQVTWVAASGANTSIDFIPPALTDTVYYRRRVISAICTTFSATVKVAVKPLPSVTWSNTSACNPEATTFTDNSTVNAGNSTTGWNWAFGDGTTSTSQNPNKTYVAAGSYTVKLIVTTNFGCEDSLSQSIVVHPKPSASFTTNTTCADITSQFTNTSNVSTGSILSYFWEFGDGDTSIAINPSHDYDTGGTYTVRLMVETDNGCRDTIDQSKTVYPNPVVSFTVNDSDQCVNGNSFIYTNNSSVKSGTNTYQWNFGASATDTSTQFNPPAKVYAFNGNYNVKLTATTNFGCTDDTTRQVIVYAKPTPQFTINDTDQCINGNSFAFTNTSTVNPVVPLTYLWKFGNGDTSTQTSPTKVYTAIGTYPVNVVVTSTNGCVDSTNQNVYVYPKPTPAFAINDTLQCFGPNNFVFTNNSSIVSGSNTYFWKFDLVNSVTDTSTQTSPSKTYTGDGVFTIRLTATSDKGCKDSVEDQVDVKPDIINNTISAPQAICEGETPDTLRQTATVSGGDNTFTFQWQESTDSSSWTSISGATNTNFAPSALSDTTWYRRIVFSGPCSDTSTAVKISVTPAITNNTISADQTICYADTPTQFNGVAPGGGNNIFGFLWQQSSDTVTWVGASNSNTTQSYQAPPLTDTVYYRRRVISAACTTFSNRVKVAVKPLPVVAFGTTTECFPDATVFTDSSTVNQGSNTNFNWTFGDGTSSTTQSPSKNYVAGSYTVKLVVTTNFGCQDSLSKNVVVHPKPNAVFSSNDTCFRFTSDFVNNSTVSTGSILSRSWDFGDGDTSNQINPSHNYANSDSFDVRLIVTTDNNCKDTVTNEVVIYPKPIAAFSVNDSTQCINGNDFAFTNNSTLSSGTNTYLWNFGESANDTNSQATPANKVYASNGSYTVTLFATSDLGCLDTADKPMTVFAKPTPTFAVNDTDQCINGNSFVFTNNSTINPSQGLSYVWKFGNGDTSSQTSPTYVYANADTFTVRMVVTSINDCKDFIEQDIYVYPKPTVDFTINDTLQCFGPNIFTYTNNSTISSGTLTHLWRYNVLAANDTSTQFNPPAKTYGTDGIYTVRLTETSNFGCKDSLEKQVEVKPDIINNAISANQFICEDDVPAPLTQTSENVSGGNNTFAYQWQQSEDSTNWTNISGATNISFSPAALDTTTWYRRVVTSGPCADTSAPVKINVTPAITQDSIQSPQVICFAQTPAQLTSVSTTGGNGVFDYLWEQSSDATTWASATGTNTNQNYQPPALNDTTYYRRRVISGACTTFRNEVKIAVKPLPVVNFGNTTECFPNATAFTDSSIVNQGNNTNWNWDFGDGDTSIQQHPNKVYVAGTYTTKLIVTTNFGCQDSISKSITVHPKPAAGYSAANNCFGFNTPFTDTSTVSTGSITNYDWNFDDGFSSSAQSPTHNYSAFGTYNVRLIVTTDRNCKDTITNPITIHPKPQAKYGIPPSCLNDSAMFMDSSSVALGNITTWRWTFGDGDTSSAQSPTHLYPSDGTYSSKLVIVTDQGCSDSATNPVLVRPMPTVSFNGDTIECTNQNVFYTNTSTGAFRYHWNYGDGDTSNGVVGVNTFTTAGFYKVVLIGTTVFGCKDSANQIVEIVAPPDPNFTLLPDSGCAPLQVTFSNNSADQYTSYQWNFGNGQSSNVYSPPQVTYQQSLTVDTNYIVSLQATNLCGTRIVRDTVKVVPKPVANFGTNPTSGCTPITIGFTNTSAGFPDTYFWDFGNGNTSTDENPADQIYTTTNVITTYTITLRVLNQCGTDTVSRTITVLPKNAQSLFALDTTIGCVPLTVNITDLSKGAVIVNYDFGDGNSSSDPSPTYTFNDTGTFKIRQFISNTCTFDTSEQTIVVQPGPQVSFTHVPSTRCEGQEIQFNSQTSSVSGFRWDFGNGDTSVQSNPRYAYPNNGNYTITLDVVSAINSCTNSYQDTISINGLPTPILAVDTSQGCPPLAVTFTNNSPNVAFLQWKFGDGNSTSVINPTHSYTNTGVYNARLIVRNAEGCEDSVDRTIQVQPEPIAAFTQTSTFCDVPVNVSFTNASTGATSYAWDFGNGITSGLTSPTVQYNNTGIFTTVLEAQNQFGCLDTASATFEVYQLPVPDFTLDTNQGCPPVTVNFNDNSQTANSYAWDFGDGNTSTAQSPTHTYPNSGVYNVKLIVTSGGTCSDSLILGSGVTVYPTPVAGFTHTFDPNPAGYGIANFTDTSKNANTYLWDFGEGGTSTIPSPTHRYNYVGTYFVTQFIETAEGCRDTATVQLDVPFFAGVFVPNAFTPSAGGPDVRVFKPVATSLKTYKLGIYDTWGKLLWQSTALINGEPAEGWNGTYEGQIMQQDVYVWKIEAEFLDGSVWKGQKAPNGKYYTEGTVTLLR
jgi:PKD repeat protein